MKKSILLLFILSCTASSLWSQCINIAPVGCRFSCVPVTYTGGAPDTAAYFWSSSCGTFANPTQQDPGNLCLLFPGTCTVQLVVIEFGMAPDTCTAEIIVFDNPDGIMEGDTTICSGDCAPISVIFSSGTPPFTYQVDDGFSSPYILPPPPSIPFLCVHNFQLPIPYSALQMLLDAQ
jgi:hypothetical protein